MKPELLAPAGSLECLKAAIGSGANAVYLGGLRFGARRLAQNFKDDQLKSAIRYAHLSGAKAYVTMNTLLYDDEMKDALDFLADIYNMGADAAIVQDLGLIAAAKGQVPLELHASTQMSVHDLSGALYAKELGLKRVILARETPLKDIMDISKHVDTEVFVHGALCYCYSGQCLMSSYIDGRSGNRGFCAQPCRKGYRLDIPDTKPGGPYLLSTRELNTLKSLKDIVASGVRGIKIEGRMRSPEYVALVTSTYRKMLDKGEMPDDERLRMIALAFNREFTKGYMFAVKHKDLMNHMTQNNLGLEAGIVVSREGRNLTIRLYKDVTILPGDGIRAGDSGSEVFSVDAFQNDIVELKADVSAKEGDKVYLTSSGRLQEMASKITKPVNKPLELIVEMKVGRELAITARSGGREHKTLGPEVQKAKTMPMSHKDVQVALVSTYDLPFDVKSKKIIVDTGAFVPIRALKETWRNAISGLADDMDALGKRKRPEVKVLDQIDLVNKVTQGPIQKTADKPLLIARLKEPAWIPQIIDAGADLVLLDYYSLEGKACEELEGVSDGRTVIELPRITTNAFYEKEAEAVKRLGNRIMVHGMGAKRIFEKQAAFGGFSLNMLNSHSAGLLRDRFEAVWASPEANLFQLKMLSSIIDTWCLVQGRQEVMVTEDCIVASTEKCDDCKSGMFTITDDKSMSFPVLRDREHRSHIFNSAVTCMIDRLENVVGSGVSGIIVDIGLDANDKGIRILSSYRRVLDAVLAGGNLAKADIEAVKSLSGVRLTRRHFEDKVL